MSEDVIKEILREMQRQNEKWGEQHHDPAIWLAILTEEVGEVAESVLKEDRLGYKLELVQVAAVAIQAILDERQPLQITILHNY